MDRYKIHKAVEYIRTQPEFPFDGIDVEESLEEVLAYFGLHPQLDDEEFEVLRQELLPMAWADEESEVSRLAEAFASSGLEHLRDDSKKRRCPQQGASSLFHPSVIVAGLDCLKKVVSPFCGGNAPVR